MKRWAVLALLLLASPAFAAKVIVHWINPTTNTDGSALTNLAVIRLEWGTCVGSAFGVLQASILAPPSAGSTPIYPTGLATVCVRAYARNTLGVESVPSNVLVVNLLPTTGKPVTLGQPIPLPE